MRRSWAQPSLSRDFALLAAVILFVLVLISGWVTYTTYARHSERITADLEKEAVRIERTLAMEMENANYMLMALGRQIVLDPNRDYVKLAQVLKSFDNKGYIYTIFSWVNPDQKLVVSSNKGVLEEPVDISDRDYVQKGAVDPWKMHIGRPIEGRVSGRWVIPVAMGITDYTGKFIGNIMISIGINTLTEEISNLVKRDGISFAIVSKTLIPLTQVSDNKNFVTDNFPTQKLANVDFTQNPSGLVAQGSLFWGTGNYAYYRMSETYPYIIMLGYDANYSDETVRALLWSRLLQLMAMAVFFMFFLWIVRVRVIKPVMDLTKVMANVASGQGFATLPEAGPVEIEGLAAQVQHVSAYIDEIKRVEDELRNKMFMLKKAKEAAEMDTRSKSEFLAFVLQEMRGALNNIIGFAQVLKDQMYGPIENRKYRQYAGDIFVTGNQLIERMHDILLHAKAETGYIALQEKPLDLAASVNSALRQLGERLETQKTGIDVTLPDTLPHIAADEFRLQQIIANLLLIMLEQVDDKNRLALDAKMIGDNRDQHYLALTIAASQGALPSQEKLLSLPDRPITLLNRQDTLARQPDLRLELAKLLVSMHDGLFYTDMDGDKIAYIAILFPALRLHFQDGSEE